MDDTKSVEQETTFTTLDFELHYELSATSPGSVLEAILEDLSSHRRLHNWDEKNTTTSLKSLTGIARAFISTTFDSSTTVLLSHANVLEVLTRDGVNTCRPVIQDVGNVASHLFFSKTDTPDEHFKADRESEGDEKVAKLALSQGRIIYTQEQIPDSHRAALLLLHSFCLRLQFEDYGFIQRFIEKHLSRQCALKTPDRLQVTSPLELDKSSVQRRFKRVTISCHLPHLILSNYIPDTSGLGPIDRTILSPFGADKRVIKTSNQYLFKTSSSVMLTLVNPEESQSGEEETVLLTQPKALWTVLVVNAPARHRPNDEVLKHLTPVAQYLRGIVVLLAAQKSNAETIFDAIRAKLKENDNGDLFDDERFGKSKLYHWAISMCSDLSASIESNLRFIKRIQEVQLKKLTVEVHLYETTGTAYWLTKLEEAVFDLNELCAQIDGLREQVQEKRNALHGATAVLTARVALQQGERMKILTYHATAYLPIATVASIYSMSVLPSTATFASFFGVLAVLLMITLLTVLSMSQMQNATHVASNSFVRWLEPLKSLVRYLYGRARKYVLKYRKAIIPPINTLTQLEDAGNILQEEEDKENEAISAFQALVAAILRRWIVPQIQFPCKLWSRFYFRNHPLGGMSWNPALFLVHIILLAFWPMFVAFLVAGICVILFLDFVGFLWFFAGLPFHPVAERP